MRTKFFGPGQISMHSEYYYVEVPRDGDQQYYWFYLDEQHRIIGYAEDMDKELYFYATKDLPSFDSLSGKYKVFRSMKAIARVIRKCPHIKKGQSFLIVPIEADYKCAIITK